jgi:hypothetical protein
MSEAAAPEIGWGLIGCGDIAGKRVAAALRETPGSALVAVARSGPPWPPISRGSIAPAAGTRTGAR